MGFGYGYYYDSTYLLVFLGAVLCMVASWKVNSSFRKYSKVRSRRGITGADAAEMILHGAGIYDVRIEHITGDLTDHYSPKEKVLRLSDSVYNSTSIAAVGVAAHECGHAIQHHQSYLPIQIRSAIAPAANIGSHLSWPVIIVGLIFSLSGLLQLGIILFSFAVVFQLVTLPVETNASARAIRIVKEQGILYDEEVNGARNVLSAAALTYFAALASSILQLLRLVMLFGRRND